MLRNGCDLAEGEAVDDAPPLHGLHLPAPVAGFLGNISERIDLRLLESVAETGTSLLLVGPVSGAGPWRQRFDGLLARPGVTWVGERPSSEMPSYLAAIDVGLTPYADSAFNRASFPLKTLEYLAAGRAVVTSDLPASRWLDTDLLTIAAQPEEFAATVSVAGAAPRTSELVSARRRFAARHSWVRACDELAPHLGLDHPGRAGRSSQRRLLRRQRHVRVDVVVCLGQRDVIGAGETEHVRAGDERPHHDGGNTAEQELLQLPVDGEGPRPEPRTQHSQWRSAVGV